MDKIANKEVILSDAKITSYEDKIVIENSKLKRVVSLKENLLSTLSLVNKTTGKEWTKPDSRFVPQDLSNIAIGLKWDESKLITQNSFTFANDENFVKRFHISDIDLQAIEKSHFEKPHLLAKITLDAKVIKLIRYYQIYPECSAIICWSEVSGVCQPKRQIQSKFDSRGRLLRPEVPTQLQINPDYHDSIFLNERHLKVRNIKYTDCTDYNDNYVQEEERFSYLTHQPWLLDGNLLFAESLIDNEGLFMLKESPILSDQPDKPECDFIYSYDKSAIAQVGWGFNCDDLNLEFSQKSWRSVLGVYDSSEFADSQAVKCYLKNRCIQIPDRDWLLTCNQWGDRNMGNQFTQEFTIKEIDACYETGIPSYMLDAGWELGDFREVNKILDDDSSPFYDHVDYWEVNPEKYPDGLKNLFNYAESKGVKLLFWFNPDPTNQNINWQKDRDTILKLYNEYGCEIFKIDGVWFNTREALNNNMSLLEECIAKSDGKIRFHLDITNGARWGYFFAHHLGILFVENRYTHFRSYFPYKVHKNLWELSKYLMPQRLLFEFLNNSKERGDFYKIILDENDPFTPEKYSIDYLFAIVMFSNPLAWFEPSNLSENQQKKLKPIIVLYNKIRDDLFGGDIYPIGEKPSGTSITGFQSHKYDNSGYICVYREVTEKTSAIMKLHRIPENCNIEFKLLYGNSQVSQTNNEYQFDLPEMRSYALFSYKCI